MAVISMPYNEPMVLAGWAFRTLLERLATEVEAEADDYAVREAMAVHGLHFELLDGDQAVRLAVRLAKVADELRLELSRTPSDDDRDRQFAEFLAVLEMQLHDIYE
jgi:hypothetical protein